MANDNRSTMTRQRHERQEALREYLSERGKVNYIFDNIEKIEGQGAVMEKQEMDALLKANDQRIRLLAKYLPDLKTVEMSGSLEHDGSISITWQK
ncbi:MAG: hypothetical protein ACXQTI_02770 [Candidatus Nezhaarchaeales archaeon]